MYVSTQDPLKQTEIVKYQPIALQDIASYCMVSTTTVRRWLKDGKLTAIKLPSNQYRISITDFRNFLKRYHIPIREEFFFHL
jgi:excisionase family DNA binding protein